jgi:hypothetical protein
MGFSSLHLTANNSFTSYKKSATLRLQESDWLIPKSSHNKIQQTIAFKKLD